MQKIYLFILSSIYLVSFASNGIVFKENKNQWPSHVLFGADYKTTKFFVNNDGFNFCVYDGNDLRKAFELQGTQKVDEDGNYIDRKPMVKGHNYNVIFNNASFLNIAKTTPLTEYYNYFLGNDRTKWAGNVKAYEELLFTDIYTNIDLKLYSDNAGIKYDLIVKPHGNINEIELNYKHINALGIKDGNLIVETGVGNMTEQKPYAYQIIKGKKLEVKCQYELKNKTTVSYNLPNGYNANYELIIDPTIIVCSYGIGNDNSYNICSGASYDEFGNIFVLGSFTAGYPTTIGAFQIACDSVYDNVITKYDANGSTKIFSTYLGGNNRDLIQNAIITTTDIAIFGLTYSNNFPVTTNAYDTTYNDPINNTANDFFISKLDLTGSTLIASTYVGGSANEGINNMGSDLAIFSISWTYLGNMVSDNQGNIYVSSTTASANFPTTSGAFLTIKHTGIDNVAFKLNSNLTTLMYSTFFGGSSTENAVYSKLINGNELVICGSTTSPNFPTTPGVISTTKKAGVDIYVLHLNAFGTNLIASTFLGTTADDFAHMLDIDINNDIYIKGYTSVSSSFSCTPGLYSSSTGRQTIHKLNSNLASVIYQTKFGTQLTSSPQYLQSTAFKVDSCQNIYIAGIADGAYLPVTANKFQDYNNGHDLYIAMFNPNMLSLNFGSYFGGENYEFNWYGASYFNEKGVLYQGLEVHRGHLALTPGGLPSTAGGLPTTPGAYQTSYTATDTQYTADAFVKIDLQSFIKTTSSYGPTIKACAPFTANFNSFLNTGTVSWDFGDGSPISNQQNTTHTYPLGNYEVLLVANDANTCNKTDTVKSMIQVINPTELKITGNTKLCDEELILLTAETNEPVTYDWNTGAITNTISVQSEGIYEVTTNNGGCDSKQNIEIKHYYTDMNAVFPNVITPNNDEANDHIDLNKYHFKQVSFTVFDRWGNEKFRTDKVDGLFDPTNFVDGTYFYTLNYVTECNDAEMKTKGFITVFK